MVVSDFSLCQRCQYQIILLRILCNVFFIQLLALVSWIIRYLTTSKSLKIDVVFVLIDPLTI
jgi:hypothetical protein